MFMLFNGRHVSTPWKGTDMVSTNKALYKFEGNTFQNNAQTNNRTDLTLGKIVYISLIYHTPAS